MAASTQCGHTRAQSASRVPQAATGHTIGQLPESDRGTSVGVHSLPSLANGGRGGWWEQAFPWTLDQLGLVRAVGEQFLAIKDDAAPRPLTTGDAA
jgi:hypothetical protein